MTIELGKRYAHPRSALQMEVLRNDPDVYEMEVTLPARAAPPRAHVHLDFDQTFSGVRGVARVTVDGEDRHLEPGADVTIPRGVPHVDAWIDEGEPVVIRNRLRPNPPFIGALAETVLARLQRGEVGEGGELSRLHIAVIQAATGGQSFAADAPIAVQRLLMPVLAAVGRLRGYRVERLSA